MLQRFISPLLIAAASPASVPTPTPIVIRAISVAMNATDPTASTIGRLRWLGGLVLTSSDARFGSVSALRWARDRLVGVTDQGNWLVMTPALQVDRLTGIASAGMAPLRSADGMPLADKADSDAEALSEDGSGGWLVGFERRHRVDHYATIGGVASASQVDPIGLLGAMPANEGPEALAGTEAQPFICAQRAATPTRPNCVWHGRPLAVASPPKVEGAAPSDADMTRDGRVFVLFRSHGKANAPAAAIVEIDTRGHQRVVAVLRAPLTIDAMEGLAVREVAGRVFLYLVSDDNFDARQRTLLLAFELID